MQQDIIHLGQTLKAKRVERSLSLKEVENAISIRIHHLAAIEEGDLSKLISPVYAQGFIKKYASFLEVDSEGLFQDHPILLKMIAETAQNRQEFSYGIGSVEVRNTGGSEIKWLPNVIWISLSVGILLVGWFLGRYIGIF